MTERRQYLDVVAVVTSEDSRVSADAEASRPSLRLWAEQKVCVSLAMD